MTNHVLALLPEFLLIVCGFVVCRYTALNATVWRQAEQLVYWLLFPVLLFRSIVTSRLELETSVRFALAGMAVVACGMAAAALLSRVRWVDARRLASGAQVAFRFNSYVALALAERLGGAAFVAWTALLVAVCVPLCNVGAVWFLARHGEQDTLRELVRNPLILSTVSGLIANLMGLQWPAAVDTTLARIGGAALPLGLMAVGAGLQWGGLAGDRLLATALLAIRHLLLPCAALVLGTALHLPPGQMLALVAFAALPTASSCYVLAARMGGDGPYVAGLVTASTLLGMASAPLALWAVGALS